MKRAFTLIELLVVIAIIAILAAILFPVFAQAKEAAKKSADLSNNKQLGTATAIYLADSDDMFPLQAGQDLTGVWGFNFNKYVPHNWSAAPSNANRPLYSETFYMNSIQPYVKNVEIKRSVGSNVTTYQPAEAVVVGRVRETTNYAYNGFLSAFSSTAVAAPSRLPLLTGVNGKDAGSGWGFANPALTCATPNATCTFVGGNYDVNGFSTGCAAGNGGTGAIYTSWNGSNYWHFAKGQNWAYSDSSAKFRPTGRAVLPGAANDPMANYNLTTGTATSYYWDGCHAWLFRPNWDFNR